MNNFRRKRPRHRGGNTVLAACMALILVMLGVAFVALMLYLGGQNETRNAVDAGALNVGKQIIDGVGTRLNLLNKDARIFYDVVAKNPNDLIPSLDNDITMRGINRVWAKALLIGINADAAEREGNAGSAPQNAAKAIDGAEAISNDLQEKVVDTKRWQGWFQNLAGQNSVRMLGTEAAVVPQRGDNWQYSCMSRGKGSNIQLFGDESSFTLPPGYQLSPDAYTKSNGKFFLKGYSPITVAGKTVWFVPFPSSEKTHLVSGGNFAADKPDAKPLDWKKPIPNAYSVEGAAVKAKYGAGQRAISYAVSNPNQAFRMAIPHSFLKVHVEKPTVRWKFLPYVDWVPFGEETEYDFKGQTSRGGPTMPLGGVGCLTSSAGSADNLGLDVFLRTLDLLLFPPELNISDSQKSKMEGYMVNRINEMCWDVGTPQNPAKALTADDLHSCLNNPLTILYLQNDVQDFYIFSKDGKSVTCQPEPLALIMAPWLVIEENMYKNEPEGTEIKVIDDAYLAITPVTSSPSSTPLQIPIPFFNFIDVGTATWDEDAFWKPGSGYNGCLGTVRVKRWTDVNTLSICVP